MRLIELIKKYPDRPWNWRGLSKNPNITEDDKKMNPNQKWIHRARSLSEYNDLILSPKYLPVITLDQAIQSMAVNNTKINDLDWNYLSRNSGITFDDVKKNPTYPWNWKGLSLNPNITFKDVKSCSNSPWDWYSLSMNSSITLDDIDKNPNLPWDYGGLSLNIHINFKYVNSHPHQSWNWMDLSLNPGITFEDVKANPHMPWNWTNVSMNPGILFDNVDENPNLPWVWPALSYNYGKFDPLLRTTQIKKLASIRRKIRQVNSVLKFNFWKLYYLSRTREFCEWYYHPDNEGGKISKLRISVAIQNS